MSDIQEADRRKRLKELVEKLLSERDEFLSHFFDTVGLAENEMLEATSRLDQVIFRVLMAESLREAEEIVENG